MLPIAKEVLRLEAFHYFRVSADYVVPLIDPRQKRPIVVIESAAQHDAVMPRKHVAGPQVAVIDLWLWQQYCQLAANRSKFLIIEEGTCAEACAIEDNALRQTHEFPSFAKLFYDQFAARSVEVAEQRSQI